MNFASAFNRVVQTAVACAWISERVAIAVLDQYARSGDVIELRNMFDPGRVRHCGTKADMQLH